MSNLSMVGYSPLLALRWGPLLHEEQHFDTDLQYRWHE